MRRRALLIDRVLHHMPLLSNPAHKYITQEPSKSNRILKTVHTSVAGMTVNLSDAS